MKYKFLQSLLRILSVAISVFIFLGLTAIPALLPNSPGGVYANATDEGFRGIRLSTLEDYNNFVDNPSILPNSFVTMDMLKVIGTFQELLIYNRSDLSRYCYSICLDDGHIIDFKVNEKPLENKNPIFKFSLGEDMTKLKTDASGTYISGGITYHYNRGNLFCIDWKCHGIIYRISPSRGPFSLSDENTFMDLLLSKSPDKQSDAMDMLPDAIGAVDPIISPLQLLYDLVAWGTPVILIAAYYFIRKFYLKKQVSNHSVHRPDISKP